MHQSPLLDYGANILTILESTKEEEIILSELAKRFLYSLSEQGITGYQLKKDGIINNEATLTKIKQGKQNPSNKTIDSYCEMFAVNKSWLYTGEGEMLKDSTASSPTPSISYTKGVPYYNVDFIGGFDIVLNDQSVKPEYLIDFKTYNKATCWCNVTGHSMEPEINNGDIIALKEVDGWREYLPFGEVYGIVTDEHRTIKRVTASAKGENFLRLIPTNKSEEYQPQDIPVKLITRVYKVLGCMKRL